jgi:hypothetical protein
MQEEEEYTLLNIQITPDNHKILYVLMEEDGVQRLENKLKEVMELFEIDEEEAMDKAEEALYRAGGDFTDGEILSGLSWLNGEDIPDLTYIQ